MNKVPLLQSRRFWLLLVDVVVATLTFVVTGYLTLDAKTVDLIKFLVVTLQPIIISVVVAYTVDDTTQAVLAHKLTVAQMQQPGFHPDSDQIK